MLGRMTTFLLIRHGLTDAVGHLMTGHAAGVHLNAVGRAQAASLPARLGEKAWARPASKL